MKKTRRKLKEILMKKGMIAIFFSLSFFYFFFIVFLFCKAHLILLFSYSLKFVIFIRDAGDGFIENKSQEDSTGKTTHFAKSVILYDYSNQCMIIFITFLRFLYVSSR